MATGMRRLALGTGLALLLGGCGGGSVGGTSGGGTVTVPAPTPTPSASPTATPAPTPSPSPSPTAGIGPLAMYSVVPDIASCRAGTITQATRDSVLASVNTIRALHRLPPVTYAVADEQQAAEAALMMAANNALNHTPPATWTCYTATGYTGASSSNLYLGSGGGTNYASNEAIMGGWLDEVNNIVANNVGHRRWMLDPFATRISYGRTIQATGNRYVDASSLKVFGFSTRDATPSPLPSFVAYPYGDYPIRFFDTRALLSFTALPSATSSSANADVNYANARVTVTAGTTAMTVSNISYDNVGYGVPNNIQFAVTGLQQNVSYTVTIANVIVRGSATNYTYNFRIVP
ncbi:CAP domain-containing protein [Sphingomonas sp. RS2018]